jgi:hypothetical protein
MAEGLFEGKGGKDVIQKRIETLKNAYEQFALVWNGINDKIGKGFNFGTAGGAVKNSVKTVVDELKAAKQMITDFNNAKPVKLEFYATVEEADRLIKKFDELNKKRNEFIASGDMESADYAATYAELAKTAAQLMEVHQKLAGSSMVPSKLNDFLNDNDQVESLMEEYLQDVDELTTKVSEKLQSAMSNVGASIGDGMAATITESAEQTVNAISYAKKY